MVQLSVIFVDSFADPSGTILSSSICLPHSKEATTSRSHISLNLLSCLHTLATSPPLTMEVLAGSHMKRYEKDEYLSVLRFNSKSYTSTSIFVISHKDYLVGEEGRSQGCSPVFIAYTNHSFSKVCCATIRNVWEM